MVQMSKAMKINTGVRILLPCLVAIFSGLRFHARGYRRWRWDDAFLGVGCIWMLGHTASGIELIWRWGHNDNTQLALFWISYISFFSMLWSARLSILLCIICITPAKRDRKQREKICIGFVLLYLLEIAVICWSCAVNAEFDPRFPVPKCLHKKQVAIYHLISSTIADSILLALPLWTLRAFKRSAPRMRARFSLAFSASASTTLLSISSAAAVLCTGSPAHGYLPLIEVYLSLIVCNFPVLIGVVCRTLGLPEWSEPDPKTLPPIQFAPPPNNSSEIIPISTSDSYRSAGWNKFKTVLRSFPAASFSTSHPHLESVYESQQQSSGEPSLTAHVKSSSVADGDCEEGGKHILRDPSLQEMPPNISIDLGGLGKTTEGLCQSTPI